MNPCRKYRKQIAWHAAGVLGPDQSEELSVHLTTCGNCRQYREELSTVCRDHFAAAEMLPEAPLSHSFHQRLVQSIQQPKRASVVLSAFTFLKRSVLDWRIAIPISVLAVALLLPLRFGTPGKVSPSVLPNHATRAAIPPIKAKAEPSFSDYRLAVNVSPDALEELLAQHAGPSYDSAEWMKVSTITKIGLEP